MAPRLVHNALGPMAHKTKGMRWRIQGVCLRSDRGVCARRCAPGTNGQWLAKRCHLPFLGMRRVCAGYKKFNWPPWLILGLARRSRQENRSKEPKGCAGQYAPEGTRWIQKAMPFLGMRRVCGGCKKSTAYPADPGACPKITPEGSGETAKS